MPSIFRKKKVVLREERKEGNDRYLDAEIKDNGDLVFESQDLGDGVESIYGCSEYEWYWIVKAEDIETFKKAIGSTDCILKLIENNFSNEKAAELYKFVQDHNVPFKSWRRIDD